MNFISILRPRTLKEYLKRKAGVPDMFVSLQRLKMQGFDPKQIVDVGAFEGEWTAKCSDVFPHANILMVEAMPQKANKLESICDKRQQLSYEVAVLGSEDGKDVFFTELETASSVLEEHSAVHSRTSRKTSSLNSVLLNRNISQVDLIKLDVQGYELEVLKGYNRYISTTEVILTEVSLLEIHKGVPLLRDVVNFLGDRGFVLFDICSVSTRRPLDHALWQTDLLFVKENSAFRRDKRYSV